jgi:hypothetical protein
MQQAHELKPLIDAHHPPPCFIGMVAEGFPFRRKREPSIGLSFRFFKVAFLLFNGVTHTRRDLPPKNSANRSWSSLVM